MMWQAAWVIIMTLVVGLKVHARSGETVHALSTDDGTTFNIDRYLSPDSKADPNLKQAIQKYYEMQEGPTCNKLAGSALVDTCATMTDEDLESKGRILEGEMKLFAARYAICELSDSKDRSMIPTECASFVQTEGNSDQGDWSGYTIVDGRQQPVSRSLTYDQATREDCEQCVAALNKSPQAWTSYSNAKQNAHVWCSVVRTDIDKNDFLQKLREGIEVAGLVSDALRGQAEAIQQQREALRFFNSELRKFAQDMSMLSEKSTQVLDDHAARLEDISKATQERGDAQLERHNITLARITTEARSQVDDLLLMAHEAVEKTSTELALAKSENAEDFRQQTAYALEVLDQKIQQIFYNVSNTAHEYNLQVYSAFQQFSSHVVAVHEELSSAQEVAQNVTGQLQENQEMVKNVSQSLADVQSSVMKLIALSDRLSKMAGFISGVFDPLGPYCRYIAGTVILLLLRYFLGGPTLSQALGSICKHTLTAVIAVLRTSSKLAKRAGIATFSHLSRSGSLLKQSTAMKSVVSVILAMTGVIAYLVAKGSSSELLRRSKDFSVSQVEAITYLFTKNPPDQLVHRWKDFTASPVEAAILVMVALCVAIFVVAFLCVFFCIRQKSGTADDEMEAHASPGRKATGLPFNNPKNYGQKKWLV